jgi:hypothetical protein
MKLRLVERAWDIERRRYAVERLTIDLPDVQHWSIEQFFENVLDAQLLMAQRVKSPRVISERESAYAGAAIPSNLGDKLLSPDHIGSDGL